MNNSNFKIEDFFESNDKNTQLKERQAKLLQLIEAITHLQQSNYWKTVEEEIYANDMQKLTQQLINERDTINMFRLQGEISRLKKMNLRKLYEEYQLEVTRIKNYGN